MNRIRHHLAMAGIVIATSLAWLPTPATADDEAIVEANAGPTTVQASELQASELSQLREAGLQGSELTIQRRQGLTLITDGQGGWIVTEDETPSTQADARALSFGLGVCQGKFFLPKKVNANVEWGAYDSCATLGAAEVYRHSISAVLRMQTGLFSITRTPQYTAVSPLDSVYSKTVTAHRAVKCPKTTKKAFDVVATVMTKSVKFDPHVSGSVTLACNFEK